MNPIIAIAAILRSVTRRINLLSTFALLAGVAVLSTPTSSWAQSTWVGGTSTDWADPSNWSSGVPVGVDAIVNTASGNLATVSTDVTATSPNTLKLGDGTVGTMNVQSGGNLNVNGETWIGNTGSGVGTNNMSGGTYTANNWFAVGRGSGQGTINMTDGTIVKQGGGNLAIGIDGGSVGVLNQSGGTITCDQNLWVAQSVGAVGEYNLSGTGSIAINDWTVIGREGGHGTLNISGGSFTKTGGGQFLVGVDNSASLGIINQTGGGITNVSSDTHIGSYSAGTGIWNLNGGSATLGLLVIGQSGGSIGTFNLNTSGTLTAAEITTHDSGASSTLNFNGGTLVASGDNANFLHGLTRANVRNGGAIVDDGGFLIAISQALLHSNLGDDNAIDGGLTKNGIGTLALSGANAYTGDTTVNQGTLQLDVTGSSVGALRLANSTTLNLNFVGSYAVAHFYTNGVALPDGTYNNGNLSSFISGTGDLVVSGNISTGLWTGGGANNNWSTSGNWDQNTVPIFPIGLTFAGSTRLVNNNDLSSITASSITFDAAAGAFTLNGNDITLSGTIGFSGTPAAPVTQTINLNMAWSAGETLDVPANANLSLAGAITSGNSLTKIGNGTLILGGTDAITGLTINGGTNVITGNVTVNGGGSDLFLLANGNSAYQGTLVIQPGATLSITGSFGDDGVIGRDGGSGTVIQNGGTFTYNNDRANLWIGATSFAGTRSEYAMNGGVLDMSDKVLGVALGNGVLTTGVVNQVSGVITNVNKLWLGGLVGIGSGYYTMSGGSIYIGSGGITSFSGNYAINLGGGTVGAYASWASPLNMNLTGLNGAVTFDTAGNDITLSGALSGTGGLTKVGSGTLDLASAGNSYTGDTTVNAGILKLDAAFSGLNSTYRVTSGATLNLNYGGSSVLGHFYTNGVALPNGTYSAGNLAAFITGSGALQVAGVAFTNQPQNQVVYLNGNYHQSATFTSGTAGAAATYQWYLNGNPISGATSNSLTLNNLQITNAGNLYVVATSGSGSVTSSVVALTIYGVNNNIFAYEGFAYAGSTDASTPIDDTTQNGGFGWAGAWVGAGGTTANTSIGLGNLTGGANVPAGYDSRSISNSIEDFGFSRAGRFLDTSISSELAKQGFIDANGNIGAHGKTIYLSFLEQPNTTSKFYEFEFKKGDLSDPGRIGGIGNDTGTGDVNLRAGGVNNYSLGAGTTDVNFYVVRIDYKAGNDDVFVYRNPTSITEPLTPTLTVSNAADMSLNGLSVAAWDGPDLKVDEIRLGATYADAIGIAVSNLLPPSKTANGYTVRFACTPGHSYRIQRATVVTGPWTDLTTVVGPANAFIEYEDTAAPSDQAFYRAVTP